MDKERQIRFLYPPLVFIASLIMGISMDDTGHIKNLIATFLLSENNTSIAVSVIGLGSIILLLGFLLGTLTVFFLKLIFFRNNFIYEIKLSKKSFKKIGSLILSNSEEKIAKKDRLYAGVYFDHNYIDEKVHLWIVRRWNAFFISSSSTLALITSLFTGYFLSISLNWVWFFVVVLFVAIFIMQAINSWRETMGMIKFMVKIKSKESNKEDETDV